jgi:DNA-binding Lrp family transcriptional regulator
MRAYMFINAMRGQSLGLIKALKSVQGVTAADAITGDYDIVAAVQARDLNELRATMAGVQSIDGILKTTTCMVLSD